MRHDDFELCTAVRSHRVRRDGDFQLGGALRCRDGNQVDCIGRGGELQLQHVLSVSVLLLVAAQGVFPHKASVARVTAEGSGRIQLGPVSGVHGLRGVTPPAFPSTSAAFPTVALFGRVRVALLFVDDEVAALLGGKVAEVTSEGALLGVDPLVDFERPLAGARVSALGALDGLGGLVFSRVLPQGSLVGTLEVAVRAVEGVLGAVLDPVVRLQVALHGAAVVTKLALVRLLAGVNPDVPLQVRVDFELRVALLALERCIPLEINGKTKTMTVNAAQKKKQSIIQQLATTSDHPPVCERR